MKHLKTGRTIIPKIFSQGFWKYIAEKIRVDGKWIKMDYYSALISLDSFITVTTTDTINIIIKSNKDLIA